MGSRIIVKEWFERGGKDLADAEFLFKHNRALETVSFLAQQSAEKYLKGYLIFKGRELERTHDLVKLLQDAVDLDSDFSGFVTMAKTVTNFYFEGRYPMGYPVDFTKEEIRQSLSWVRKLVKVIKGKTRSRQT